jgi:hypothetical protein
MPNHVAKIYLVFVLALVAPSGASATILGSHAFTWWDDPGLLFTAVTPLGAPPPSPGSIALFDLREWHLDQAQTATWYGGGAIAGLPLNPFNAANRTGLLGAIPPVAGSEAFIYELTNTGFGSGGGFSFSNPFPPGLNDLSGITSTLTARWGLPRRSPAVSSCSPIMGQQPRRST